MRLLSLSALLAVAAAVWPLLGAPTPPVDFNQEVRPILSENCYKCHGPDEAARKARLRFDVRTEALKPAKSDRVAIVPGAPGKSEMMARITAADADDRMPPRSTGKKLSDAQIETLRRWIAQGAPYAKHWAYVKPVRPELPKVKHQDWPRNPIDRFILARLEREGLSPSPQADRLTLIRRVSLDLTGLPPSPEEVAQFMSDQSPRAYESLVDRLLKKDAFGEHWARMWLDLARYADSAGYADDPPRTIWLYRDYVIRSLNANKPFDRFTIEQIAGDLLSEPTEDELVATAFHRNTMTNNEGGTDDEEFRNAAVVDRVNTTMAVWMATSMACAQCHTHKFDPITQHEYFSFFAFLNNTEDADRKDEAPVLELYTRAQKQQRARLSKEIADLESKLKKTTPELLASQAKWESSFPLDLRWTTLRPASARAVHEATTSFETDAAVPVTAGQESETYDLEMPLALGRFSGLRIEAGAESTNLSFVIKRVSAKVLTSAAGPPGGRYLRVELPGKNRILSLAEVQVFHKDQNLSLHAKASQSSTAYEGAALLATDGNTDGNYDAKSTTHTEESTDPWWEVDLGASQSIDRIVIWNRTDNELQGRLAGFRVAVLDENRQVTWGETVKEPPKPSAEFILDGSQVLRFSNVYLTPAKDGFDAAGLVAEGKTGAKGLVIGADTLPQSLTLLPSENLDLRPGCRLQVKVLLSSDRDQHSPGWLRFLVTEDQRILAYAATPGPVVETLALERSKRTSRQESFLMEYYRTNVAPELKEERAAVVPLRRELAGITPQTVPIVRELAGDKRRKTHVQLRGNHLSLDDEVSEAVPAVFQPLPAGGKADRLALAYWLVDPENPLTSRVTANRFWEQIFGVGIVRTSEDFGSQGDLPTHPELLDWLATELVDQKWDVKGFLKMLVTSATYCQSSRVTKQLEERDPDNLLLARAPRFRMGAEVVRDQALAVSGLLSSKMYGPSVRPARPALGLSAAFGSSLDWKTSEGEDRYRRALYIEWRRTSPYPSMATFDAPNREVCALRRPRSNTPLQALVTLNDPVFVEAAQSLSRRMASHGGSAADKIRFGFELCLIRPPRDREMRRVVELYRQVVSDYARSPEQARRIAFDASTPPAEASKPEEMAALTAVANVLLNLDETLMRP
jgi:hypothetical protein